jgi:uncharacterized membrane protein YdbT with pleckstrin-like domain
MVLSVWDYLKITKTWIKLDEQGVTIRKGIIAEKRSTFLYSQIQDIKEGQAFFDIIFGVKRLRIVTMTYFSASATELPLFNSADADEIKNTIFEKIKIAESLKNKKKEKKLQEYKLPKYKQTSDEITLTLELNNVIFGVISIAIGSIGYIFLQIFAIAIYLALNSLGVLEFLGYLNFESIKNIFLFSLIVSFLPAIGFIFLIITMIITYLFSRLANFKVSISNNKFEMQFGLFSIKKTSFDISKIQDIVITSNIVERLFNLSNIKTETGSLEMINYANKSEQMLNINTIIPHISREKALWFREILFSGNGLNQIQDEEPLSKRIPLEPHKPIKKTMEKAITFFILLSIAITLQFLFIPKLGLLNILGPVLAFACVVIGKYLFELLYYKNYYYNKSEDIIYIRKGVVVVTEIAIPFNRVENIFIDQDIFDRILGLYDLHISTVTPVSDMEAHIDGLSKENAEKLKMVLLEKIKKASEY